MQRFYTVLHKVNINISVETQGELMPDHTKRECKQETKMLHIRVTDDEKAIIESHSKKYNFRSISEYLRFLALNEWDIKIK
jgi:predicted glycosyltransferase involved in capsule biosynthesis